jgi:5-bromo-4-chloroindolyl phosphate hydrolysis protein
LQKNDVSRQFVTRFNALFRLDEIYGLLKLSPVYLNKINQWLHNDELLLKQIRKQVNSN